ncbi:hypothetical protein [Streptomyces cinereoruber]|uniref:hypothetical protein n=1 Tax=Streptomyces cinereoruber TaxID=67260 RepID=UPI001FB86C22|nr:hypothetical protein [Streptomyces cinereoruber]NIH63989.1 hypothetical protein [Streptomyces cinereoruber]
MTDVNGDGLTDRVFTDGTNPIKVALNTGTGFTAPAPFRGSFSQIAVDKNASLGAGVYFNRRPTHSRRRLRLQPRRQRIHRHQPGRNQPTGRQRRRPGRPRQVHPGQRTPVAVNKAGRTNLLRSVSRPMGARIDLDYTRSGNTAAMPESRWVRSPHLVFGRAHGRRVPTTRSRPTATTRGANDRLEREFLGFGRVVTEDRDTGADEHTSRRTGHRRVPHRTDT